VVGVLPVGGDVPRRIRCLLPLLPCTLGAHRHTYRHHHHTYAAGLLLHIVAGDFACPPRTQVPTTAAAPQTVLTALCHWCGMISGEVRWKEKPPHAPYTTLPHYRWDGDGYRLGDTCHYTTDTQPLLQVFLPPTTHLYFFLENRQQ